MARDYIIMIAGSYLQFPMLCEIRNRGYEIVLLDGNHECYCRQYADEFHTIDTYDIENCIAMVKLLTKKYGKPKAVVSDGADISIVVSSVCEAIDLPCVSLRIAEVINNKARLHDILGFATNPVWMLSDGLWSTEAWDNWLDVCRRRFIQPLPVVAKPLSNCGSRGVVRINDLHEWDSYFHEPQDAQKYGQTDIIIEECLSGSEIATDWWVKDGKVNYINGAERVFGTTFGIEAGHTNPLFPVPDKVRQLAQSIVDATGYKYGPLKVDFINDPQYGWCLLEAATRWSGGYDHAFTAKISTGRDLVSPILDYALGKDVTVNELQTSDIKKYAAALGIYYNHDKIDINHLGEVEKLAGYESLIKTGTYGSACAARNLWILTSGKTKDVAWNVTQLAKQILQR